MPPLLDTKTNSSITSGPPFTDYNSSNARALVYHMPMYSNLYLQAFLYLLDKSSM